LGNRNDGGGKEGQAVKRGKTKKADVVWRWAVVNSIAWLGKAHMEHIYKRVGNYRQLNPEDLKAWKDGRPIYEFTVRATVYDLMADGLVKRVSRGVYTLTEKGYAYLREEPIMRELTKMMKEKGLATQDFVKILKAKQNERSISAGPQN